MFEPYWNCRLCGSRDLLATTQCHCPNCGHERDVEAITFPDWDDLVSVDDHRFAGEEWRCCDTLWSDLARHCGCCGTRRRGLAQIGVRNHTPTGAPARIIPLHAQATANLRASEALRYEDIVNRDDGQYLAIEDMDELPDLDLLYRSA